MEILPLGGKHNEDAKSSSSHISMSMQDHVE